MVVIEGCDSMDVGIGGEKTMGRVAFLNSPNRYARLAKILTVFFGDTLEGLVA